jgi:hypothetical protein
VGVAVYLDPRGYTDAEQRASEVEYMKNPRYPLRTSWLARLGQPKDDMFCMLKGSTRCLSLHDSSDRVLEVTSTKLIFGTGHGATAGS